jgi:hypothetical protein
MCLLFSLKKETLCKGKEACDILKKLQNRLKQKHYGGCKCNKSRGLDTVGTGKKIQMK